MIDINLLLEKTPFNKIDFNEMMTNIFKISGKILLILFFTYIAIKIANNICKKVFSKKISGVVFNENENKTLERALQSFVKGIIIFTGFSSIMSIFNINMTSILAVAGVGSLAIGFAAQGLVRDFLTGGFILLENQYNIGDFIEVNGIKGTVEDITLRITKLRSFNGSLHIIPNGEITMVTSMSKEFTRAVVNIGVAYNEDIDNVINIIKEAVAGCEDTIENLLTPPEILGISEFKETNINILLFANCKPSTHYGVERDIRLIIRKAFEKEGITPPIPQKIINIKEGYNGL